MSAGVPGLLYSVSRAQHRIVFLCVRSELKRACRRRRGEEAHRSSAAAAARDSAPRSGPQRRSSWLEPGERGGGHGAAFSLLFLRPSPVLRHTSERNPGFTSESPISSGREPTAAERATSKQRNINDSTILCMPLFRFYEIFKSKDSGGTISHPTLHSDLSFLC
ncbi:hypothetical protein KOW79_012420 [Hemibagrus wyckioides]|uniref:Uncharacterized protein n=1 Tax=Hemibagrus wyckioides TaxID=337641 RepID=A0A9D3NM40_9TELE|nr:hypothetical protein KOW79_012420 [Hemibagrus wyckioides]